MPRTAAAAAAHAGIKILIGIFASHPPARSEILNVCQARLIGTSEEQCLPYLRLLSVLVRQQPALVASELSCLKASTLCTADNLPIEL